MLRIYLYSWASHLNSGYQSEPSLGAIRLRAGLAVGMVLGPLFVVQPAVFVDRRLALPTGPMYLGGGMIIDRTKLGHMVEEEFSEADLQRTLDLAAGYLNEAETVLWQATTEGSTDVTDQLEDLTHNVWAVQQQLQDLQAELDRSGE